MKFLLFKLSIVFFSVFFSCSSIKINGPYFATGIKIGEVTQTEVIIWVRLTQNPERVGNNAPMPDVKYIDSKTGKIRKHKNRLNETPVVTYPENFTVKTIQGATPGSEGKVRIKYKIKEEKEWTQLEWETVDRAKDFIHQFKLSKLSKGKEYQLLVEASSLKNNAVSASISGEFKTAPGIESSSDINFIVVTGTAYVDVDSETGFKLYPGSLKFEPEFFVHTGDIIYYDRMAKTKELALWHWDRMYSLPDIINFHCQVASYFIKDDHDVWMDDCYPGMKTRYMGEFTYEQGTQIFLDEVPMGEKTYRTVRWGKDLQIWLVEGRDYRSSNDIPDGPEKTIWGKEQMDWFKSTVELSDATYKVLISPTPIIGPDRKNKNDNHANSGFKYEGDQLRKFISEQENMVIVCGDRHWQYISKDLETGVIEFSCGPASNKHAGGWRQSNKLPEHLYLNVTGGFMEGIVSQADGKSTLTFRHYDPDGKLLNEYIVE